MIKYNFHGDDFPIYSIVKYITIIGNSCLIENIISKKRKWIMKYEIYPLSNKELDNYGDWSYSKEFDNIAKQHNYK